jgi:hypothetical protein
VSGDLREVAQLILHPALLGHIGDEVEHAVGTERDSPMQEDAAHAADRPLAGRHGHFDDLRPATHEHPAHPHERLLFAEVGCLFDQPAAHADLDRHTDHVPHRLVRPARLEVGDHPAAVPDRPQHADGIRHEVERRPERHRALAEQAL